MAYDPLLVLELAEANAAFSHQKNLLAEWCIYNARPEKQRRAVLVVLPFVGARGSGSKYAAITLNICCQKAVVATLGYKNSEG